LPDVSGVGISFGADRIYDVLAGLNKFPQEVIEGTKILFSNMDETSVEYSIPIVKRLRAKGINCEIYPDKSKLKKQFDYAAKKGIPYFAIIGETEVVNGTVNIKDLAKGEQKTVPASDIDKIL
jgi:histidyl-tRNA synthetase